MLGSRVLPLLAWVSLGILLVSATCTPRLTTVFVADGFDLPVFVTAPDGDPRLFVVEQTGLIRILDPATGVALVQPFLDLTTRVSVSNERGLLGLAFAPDYGATGEFYVYYTGDQGLSTLSRFVVSAGDPNVADPTEFVLLTQDQPASNHNGGTVAFGPDGMLFLGLGDGGPGNDPDNAAQDGTTWLGKMLRLDVSGGPASPYSIPPDNPFVGVPEVLDEIWALGLRNPYRFSFDRATGDLWIGDVGQGAWEEIDFEPASDPGGRNYGWRVHEGTACHLPSPEQPCEDPLAPVTFTFPVHEYGHLPLVCDSVTGGVVNRRPGLPFNGWYLFGDFCRDQIWRLGPAGAVVELTAQLTPPGGFAGVSAIAEGGFGEVYVVSYGDGTIYRIARAN